MFPQETVCRSGRLELWVCGAELQHAHLRRALLPYLAELHIGERSSDILCISVHERDRVGALA